MSSPEVEFVLFAGTSSGEGKTLEGAIEEAYKKGKHKAGKECFRVVEIHVCGDNPISDYKVWVTPL